jgi:hypothetical protein
VSFRPPHEAPPQEILRTIVDPDFGPLNLVRKPFWGRAGSAPWTLSELVEWLGARDGIEISITAERGDLQPELRNGRQAMARLLASPGAVLTEAAAAMIQTAREWADSGDLDEPTLETLQAALDIDSVTYSYGRITVWISETADIFAGHAIEMRYDDTGTLEESCLAG